MGDFIGTKAMAEIWDCKPSQITQWCRDGKIPGAEQDRKKAGKTRRKKKWFIL